MTLYKVPDEISARGKASIKPSKTFKVIVAIGKITPIAGSPALCNCANLVRDPLTSLTVSMTDQHRFPVIERMSLKLLIRLCLGWASPCSKATGKCGD